VRHAFVSPIGFFRRKLHATRWGSVDSSAHLLTRTSNTDWNQSDDNMQKSMCVRWLNESLHEVCKSQCWKNVLIMHSALLQH